MTGAYPFEDWGGGGDVREIRGLPKPAIAIWTRLRGHRFRKAVVAGQPACGKGDDGLRAAAHPRLYLRDFDPRACGLGLGLGPAAGPRLL